MKNEVHEMKKEVLVFIFDSYADWEPAFVCPELNNPETDYVVKTISLDSEPKRSMGGFRVLPDYTVDHYPKDFSFLLLAGGLAWMERKNDAVLPVVDYAVRNHIPVGAICNATNFMAQNGFLDHVRHTGNTLEFMKSQAPQYSGGELYLEKQAVSDSGIITANGSGALEFSREILLLLNAKTEDGAREWYGMHKYGFYQD